ncbi:MAG TPA: magnesium chelatase [Fibrobacteria bacterium]|nr:magnesium chelatase [Fibrobacteria bacterium]
MSHKPKIHTLGELKQSGWRSRSVRDELRENLLERLRSGQKLFPGLHGYDDTVVRSLVNALLARHDILLLGLRGQGKTRLLRQLPTLLDEWMPALAGTDLREDPFSPVTTAARRLVSELGEDAPLEWIHREERYREKLATPDTSMADLIGDIDPVKAVSQGIGFGHEDAVQWGIVPRSNRGIFAINELPDLQPRIQVGLLNLLEERDIQIRGIPLRLDLDVMFAFSANPEDYTRRGNLITPLKDRIGSQILTHYPKHESVARAITDQEAWTGRGGPTVRIPAPLRDAVERIAFEGRKSTDLVDPRSGVSQRLSIAALETLHSAVEARCALLGTDSGEARLADLFATIPAITGKLELAMEGEREGSLEVARLLVAKACKAVFDATFKPPVDRRRNAQMESLDQPVVGWFEGGNTLDISGDLPDEAHRESIGSIELLEPTMRSLARDPAWNPGQDLTAWKEIFLEGLHQHGRIKRSLREGRVEFGDALSRDLD